MSLLAILTAKAGPNPTDPTPPVVPEAQPLRLLTWDQTVDAPVEKRDVLVAGPSDPPLITGQTVPLASLRRVGADSWEFLTDAAAVNFRLKQTGYGYLMRAFQVYVDGAPVASNYVRCDTSAQVRIALGEAGTWRTVRLDLSSHELTGLDAPEAAAFRPAPSRRTLYILGDSWVAGASYRPKVDGTGNENGPGIEHMAFLTGRLLDAALVADGIGGTGYGNGEPAGRHYASEARLDRLVAARPDVVLVFGSINDINSDGSGIGQYASQVYQRIATDLPGVPVLVCGVQDWGQGFNGTDSSPEMTRAVAAAPNVKGYVQPLVEDWVAQGDNTINNAAYNNAHLTVKGNRYYAEKLAAFIARSLNIPAA